MSGISTNLSDHVNLNSGRRTVKKDTAWFDLTGSGSKTLVTPSFADVATRCHPEKLKLPISHSDTSVGRLPAYPRNFVDCRVRRSHQFNPLHEMASQRSVPQNRLNDPTKQRSFTVNSQLRPPSLVPRYGGQADVATRCHPENCPVHTVAPRS